jgi:hypothetical protein
LGERYMAIATFIQQGPAMLKLRLGDGAEASFMVAQVSPQPDNSGPPGRPSSAIALAGPCGNSLYLDEEQISYVQPEGPQDGAYLHITLDNGTSLVFTRPPEMPKC